jgi:hypothetical protein
MSQNPVGPMRQSGSCGFKLANNRQDMQSIRPHLRHHPGMEHTKWSLVR